MDWSKLLELAPLALMKPGSPEGAAMMQGYMQSQQRMQQQRMQEHGMQRQDALAQAQLGNMQADNQRADQQIEMQKAAQALARLTASRREGLGALETLQQQPDTQLPAGIDPLQAQNALVVDQLGAQQAYGVPEGTPQTPLPNMTALVSEGKKRRAAKRYEAFAKSYGQQAAEAENSVTDSTGEFAGMTFAAIRGLGQSVPPAPPAPKTRIPAQPGSMEEYINATPERQAVILAARKAYNQSDDRPRVNVNVGGPAGTLPPAIARRVDAKAKGFDAQAIVKTTQKMAEAVGFANSLDPNTKNPADDQALIYAFAKAMDPDSVVREGEYATVQKYAQAWAETFGFNAARLFTNTSFLTPQARLNMKQTIQKRYAAGRVQYDNVRKSYAAQIDKITGQPGSGEEWLVDYGGAFPADQPSPVAAPPPTANPYRR